MACFTRTFALIMEIVVISLTLICVKPSTAAIPGPCPFTPLIEAQEGDNVTLQCCFDASANLQKRTVDWKRADLKTVVHVYRHGRDDPDPQMLQYRDRTTLNREDLTRGIITLQISSVQLSDSGEYMCNVPKLTAKFITLKVSEHQQSTTKDYSTTTRSPAEEETNKHEAEKKDIGAIVGGVCASLGALVIGVLMKHGKIQECWRKLKGEKKRVVENTNSPEQENLNHLRDNGDLNVSAGNDSGDNEEEV